MVAMPVYEFRGIRPRRWKAATTASMVVAGSGRCDAHRRPTPQRSLGLIWKLASASLPRSDFDRFKLWGLVSLAIGFDLSLKELGI